MFSQNYSNLSIPQLQEKINLFTKELIEFQKSYDFYSYAIVIVFAIFFVALFIDTQVDIKKNWILPFAVLFLLVGEGLSFYSLISSSFMKNELESNLERVTYEKDKKERELVEVDKLHNIQELLRGLDTDSVTVVDLIQSRIVSDNYCPELTEGEDCYLLEFLSDKEITQSFIPLNKESFKNVKNSFAIEFFVFNEEAKAAYLKFNDMGEEHFFGGIKVYSDNFVIGKSIIK